jgi:hypothetical protein
VQSLSAHAEGRNPLSILLLAILLPHVQVVGLAAVARHESDLRSVAPYSFCCEDYLPQLPSHHPIASPNPIAPAWTRTPQPCQGLLSGPRNTANITGCPLEQNMPPPRPPDERERSPDPTTPRRVNARRSGNGPSTPNSAPAAAPAAAARQRQRSSSKKPEPTLLTDFLRGKPSPARIQAQRQRRKSLDIVQAEMREADVRKLQQPGGVRDRVKTWQKVNARAMVQSDPFATPSEPTEVAFPGDTMSVDEDDRIRIKFRQQKKPSKPIVVEHDDHDDDFVTEDDLPSELRPKGPPKKRVVSDDHWMSTKIKKSPPRGTRQQATAKEKEKDKGSPMPIPKDFLQKTAQNPPVSRKIQDWAARVEIPEPSTPRSHISSRSRGDSSDGIRVRPLAAEKSDGEVKKTPKKSPKPRLDGDDGIRVTPIRMKKLDDDGIRVRPMEAPTVDDDGIRIRPSHERPSGKKPERVLSARQDSIADTQSMTSITRDFDHAIVVEEDDHEQQDIIEVIEDPESEPDTPTRRRPSKSKPVMPRKSRTSHLSRTDEQSDDRSWVSTSDPSSLPRTVIEGSDLSSIAPGNKPLADIPFGYSAFSELDLPTGRSASKRPKAQRTPSFKAVPKVLKKVVSEGKKIIHDTVDPPKPVVNQPPSIEKWLKNTVDPFVDAPAEEVLEPKVAQTMEKEWAQQNQARRRSSTEAKSKKAATAQEKKPEKSEQSENEENLEPEVIKEAEPPKDQDKTPTSLKRSKATRTASSPAKSAGKRPLREAIKDAFKGESSGHKYLPTTYGAAEEDLEQTRYREEEDWGRHDRRRRSSSTRRRSPSPDPPSTVDEEHTPTMAGPRRRPPTNGLHELSTIASVESFSTGESDLTSVLSQTTVTQTTITQSTATTRDSQLSRAKSQRAGLKRRLTKHSDLVSVLSLPDDSKVPSGLKNMKSRPSLRRGKSHLDTITMEDLLREFSDDENIYQRELKTLVDGVVPVLLHTVVHNGSRSSVNLFGPDSPGRKADNLSKAVVDMGISLEKLKASHKKAPKHDINQLLDWLQTVAPIYSRYLDSWRLGFQDLIVNLAPPDSYGPDDEDSLLDALPRNEHGDVVNENGERVDVAHLLKRPLIRLKFMLKFLKVSLNRLMMKIVKTSILTKFIRALTLFYSLILALSSLFNSAVCTIKPGRGTRKRPHV